MRRISALTWAAMLLLLATGARAETPVPQSLTPAGFAGSQPQAAISPSGDIYVVFGQREAVYLTVSTSHGQSFSAPARVADVPGMMLGMRRGPRIAVSSGRIVVLAPSKSLVSFISDDNGKTWSQPVPVSDSPGTTGEGLDNLTALPDGSFFAVWMDSRSGTGMQVEGARLDAGAKAWSKNVPVYTSPEKTVCQCCHPSVIAGASGKITVMWRNALAGNRDFYIAESTDRGDTFSPAAKLGEGSWKLNACPMDGGSLAATSDGIVAVWRRQDSVFITSKPGERETHLARAVQPVIAEINGHPAAAYQSGHDIVLNRGNGSAPEKISTGTYPSLASSPDGKEAILVWEHTEGDAAASASASASAPQYVVIH